MQPSICHLREAKETKENAGADISTGKTSIFSTPSLHD
jgi:hypothetical protein